MITDHNCFNFSELYEISILKEEHGHYVKCIILAFYDKVLLLPFETENLVVVYLFEEVRNIMIFNLKNKLVIPHTELTVQ